MIDYDKCREECNCYYYDKDKKQCTFKTLCETMELPTEKGEVEDG